MYTGARALATAVDAESQERVVSKFTEGLLHRIVYCACGRRWVISRCCCDSVGKLVANRLIVWLLG